MQQFVAISPSGADLVEVSDFDNQVGDARDTVSLGWAVAFWFIPDIANALHKRLHR